MLIIPGWELKLTHSYAFCFCACAHNADNSRMGIETVGTGHFELRYNVPHNADNSRMGIETPC